MAQINSFECKLQETEATHIMDLSDIMSSMQNYAQGARISSESFQFADLNAKINFYPTAKNKKHYCSFYIKLFPIQMNDNRKVMVTIKCGSITRSLCNPATSFESGRGYKEFLAASYVAAHPLIKFTIKMNHNSEYVAEKLPITFEDRQASLYELSKSDGDITLIVINGVYAIKSPPHKKQRLDNIEEGEEEKQNVMKASSIILKSSSPVFNNMLSNNMMERKEKKIEIYAKSMEDVDNMIYFMCTNELRDTANAMSIIELSDYYQIQELKLKCINKMIESISVDKFVDTINIFDRYSITNGYNTLIEFAKNNLVELKQTDKFDQLSHAFKMTALEMFKN